MSKKDSENKSGKYQDDLFIHKPDPKKLEKTQQTIFQKLRTSGFSPFVNKAQKEETK